MFATVAHPSIIENNVIEPTDASIYIGGQIIGNEQGLAGQVYEVIAGEVVIISNGQTVDLVEAGELLDDAIWPDATIVAWTDCVLMSVGGTERREATPPVSTFVTPTELQKQLALAA